MTLQLHAEVCSAGIFNYLFLGSSLSRDQAISGCSHFVLPCSSTLCRDTLTNDHILVYSIRHSEMDRQWSNFVDRHDCRSWSKVARARAIADHAHGCFFRSYVTPPCSRLFTNGTNRFSRRYERYNSAQHAPRHYVALYSTSRKQARVFAADICIQVCQRHLVSECGRWQPRNGTPQSYLLPARGFVTHWTHDTPSELQHVWWTSNV
jgi:hypothetical protein